MHSRVRLTLAGLVALLALGSILSMSAFAGPGPFWRQRQVGEGGNGVKIAEKSPEKFQAKSGLSRLAAVVGTEPAKIECDEDRAGGIIYNNSLQGQGKITVTYSKCHTNLPFCKVNEPIVFKANYHLMWKYRGIPKELEGQKRAEAGQVPDLLFYRGEIQQGQKGSELEKQEFVTITLKSEGGTCSAAGLALKAKGYESATITSGQGKEAGELEKFATTASIGFTPGPHEQDFWNGIKQEALTTSLQLIENKASFESQDEVGPFLTQANGQQEVAIFES
jgi:hypothetical protein